MLIIIITIYAKVIPKWLGSELWKIINILKLKFVFLVQQNKSEENLEITQKSWS